MRVHIISVGREGADPLVPQTSDYISRIRKFVPIDTIVIRSGPEDKVLQRMQKEVARCDIVVAMDERGELMNSKGFAKKVESWMNAAVADVGFVIGGADGLPAEMKETANVLLALSPMTFPHRMAKLFLAEQIYRSLCRIRNIPYNK